MYVCALHNSPNGVVCKKVFPFKIMNISQQDISDISLTLLAVSRGVDEQMFIAGILVSATMYLPPTLTISIFRIKFSKCVCAYILVQSGEHF